MKSYATFYFEQSPVCDKDYILVKQIGGVLGLEFGKYKTNEKNDLLKVSGKEYMRLTVPRKESMRKYFAYTFEMKPNVPITSVESLDEANRTFGDAKKIGLNDLILFHFSKNRKKLIMWFIKDKGFSRITKTNAYTMWCQGEEIT